MKFHATHVRVQFYQTNNSLVSDLTKSLYSFIFVCLLVFSLSRNNPFVLLFTWKISTRLSKPNILRCLPDPKSKSLPLRLSQPLDLYKDYHTSIELVTQLPSYTFRLCDSQKKTIHSPVFPIGNHIVAVLSMFGEWISDFFCQAFNAVRLCLQI